MSLDLAKSRTLITMKPLPDKLVLQKNWEMVINICTFKHNVFFKTWNADSTKFRQPLSAALTKARTCSQGHVHVLRLDPTIYCKNGGSPILRLQHFGESQPLSWPISFERLDLGNDSTGPPKSCQSLSYPVRRPTQQKDCASCFILKTAFWHAIDWPIWRAFSAFTEIQCSLKEERGSLLSEHLTWTFEATKPNLEPHPYV